jgi:DNA-binding transcriptional LysR family regulator
MALTDEGQRFLEEARPAVQGLERALHRARQKKNEIGRAVRIIGARTTFQPIIWELIERFCDM